MNTPDFRNYKNAEIDKTIDAAMTSLRTITGNSMDLNIMNVKICSVKCALVSIEGMISTSQNPPKAGTMAWAAKYHATPVRNRAHVRNGEAQFSMESGRITVICEAMPRTTSTATWTIAQTMKTCPSGCALIRAGMNVKPVRIMVRLAHQWRITQPFPSL